MGKLVRPPNRWQTVLSLVHSSAAAGASLQRTTVHHGQPFPFLGLASHLEGRRGEGVTWRPTTSEHCLLCTSPPRLLTSSGWRPQSWRSPRSCKRFRWGWREPFRGILARCRTTHPINLQNKREMPIACNFHHKTRYKKIYWISSIFGGHSIAPKTISANAASASP